jgi:hypothetical protein
MVQKQLHVEEVLGPSRGALVQDQVLPADHGGASANETPSMLVRM